MPAHVPPVILAAALSLNGVWEPLSPARRRALATAVPKKEGAALCFATPDEAARLLEAGQVSGLVLLWRAVLHGAPGAAGLALPFRPPEGRARLVFRLLSVAPAPKGLGHAVIARYAVEKRSWLKKAGVWLAAKKRGKARLAD